MTKKKRAREKGEEKANKHTRRIVNLEVDESEEEEKDDEEELDEDARDEADYATSIKVLDLLGRRPDLFHAKGLKAVRQALFPLMQKQERHHFERPVWSQDVDGHEALALLQPKSPAIASLFRTIARFETSSSSSSSSSSVAGGERVVSAKGHGRLLLFSSAENKAFRKALHPLVTEKLRGERESERGREGSKGGSGLGVGVGAEDQVMCLCMCVY